MTTSWWKCDLSGWQEGKIKMKRSGRDGRSILGARERIPSWAARARLSLARTSRRRGRRVTTPCSEHAGTALSTTLGPAGENSRPRPRSHPCFVQSRKIRAFSQRLRP